MTTGLKIGVAGVGAIGRTHIERINQKLKGASVVAVTDVAAEHGKKIADQYGCKFFPDGHTLIASGEIDALMVTAADGYHEQYVMSAVEAEMPVFCEKPLAPEAAACKRIVDAEITGGKHLVQVGFMRRYDSGYRQLKSAIISGKYGAPLMMNCAHRNFDVPAEYDTSMAISNTMIHEIDVLRWLIGEDYDSVEVALPRSTKHTHANLIDPQVMILYSKSGVRMSVECFVNCRVGYDIQCEVCCEEGFIKLPDLAFAPLLVNASRVTPICRDWSERFIEAYNTEIQEWIDATKEKRVDGPTAWDGYVACITADTALKARESGLRQKISIPECPNFYKA